MVLALAEDEEEEEGAEGWNRPKRLGLTQRKEGEGKEGGGER